MKYCAGIMSHVQVMVEIMRLRPRARPSCTCARLNIVNILALSGSHDWWIILAFLLALTRFVNYTGTLTTPHDVHCCNCKVDVGPQIWKHVLTQATWITTSLCHINDSTLSTDVSTHDITGYIWLHCSYVEGWWRIPFEKPMFPSKWDDLEVMTLSQFTCGTTLAKSYEQISTWKLDNWPCTRNTASLTMKCKLSLNSKHSMYVHVVMSNSWCDS